MPASILKQCAPLYIEPPTHLINLSFTQGHCPNELKIARVIPLCKGENELIQNYRLILFLNTLRNMYFTFVPLIAPLINLKKT